MIHSLILSRPMLFPGFLLGIFSLDPSIFYTHSWGGVQVPFFIIVQCFHFFKKDSPQLSVKRIFTRVLLPFIYIQLFIVLLLFVGNGFSGLSSIIGYFPVYGAYGQGDYYPIIYVQVALLLPFFFLINRKFDGFDGIMLIVYILLCEGLEIICSVVHVPDSVYRFLVFRYVFLIYFGWKWAREGIDMNSSTIVLSLISLLSIIYFHYIHVNNEPFFLNTVWRYHRWPCYFYMACLLVYMLNIIWSQINTNLCVVKSVKMLSKYSYDIFLAQMVAYVLFPPELFKMLPGVTASLSRFFAATIFSILFGFFVHNVLLKLSFLQNN